MTNQGNLWLVATILAAPFIGSWLGVMIERWPRGQAFAWNRSCCVACGATLGVIDLIPIISYVVLRGQCRRCHAPIPRRLLVIELASLLIAIIAALVAPAGPDVAVTAAFGATLFTLAWIDAETMRLPDAITLPLLLAGLLDCAWFDRPSLAAHAAAAALAYLGLRALGWAYRRSRGVEGLGAGDAKLFAAGGAWLGPAALPDVLVLAGLFGIIGFGILIARGGTLALRSRIPFGPALALAVFLLWLRHAAQLS